MGFSYSIFLFNGFLATRIPEWQMSGRQKSRMTKQQQCYNNVTTMLQHVSNVPNPKFRSGKGLLPRPFPCQCSALALGPWWPSCKNAVHEHVADDRVIATPGQREKYRVFHAMTGVSIMGYTKREREREREREKS